MLWFAATLAVIAIILLVLNPRWGIPAIFIVRPIVDVTWASFLFAGFKLTEIVSAAVALLIIVRMCIPGTRASAFARMPLRWIWLIWSVDVVFFSAHIMLATDVREGLNILFRHLNGLAGFYMVQANLADERGSRRFLYALAVAGLFPIAMGVFEAVTGHHWSAVYGEGGLLRNVGMYHDAIAIRYFAMQTILALLLIAVIYFGRRLLLTVIAAAYGVASASVVYFAYSKSGSLTLASWLLFWSAFLRRGRLLGLVALTGLTGFVMFNETAGQRVATVFNKEISVISGASQNERLFSGRWYIWRDMLDEWSRLNSTEKIFGSGHSALGAHNDYLQVLYHGGFVALAIYAALLLTILARIARDLFRRRDPWSVAALSAFTMWIVDTIGLIPSAYSGYQWFIWGMIGLCLRRRADATVPVRRASPAANSLHNDALVRASAQ